MAMNWPKIASLCLCCSVICLPAAGQVQEYHHRTTAAGDIISAEAERELALGIATHRRALAQESLARAERQREDSRYRRFMNLQNIARHRAEQLAAKRQQRLAKKSSEQAKTAERAKRLVDDVLDGAHPRPAALQESRAAVLMAEAEDIVAQLSLGDDNLVATERVRLAQIAARLRAMIHGRQIGKNYLERQRAIRVVKLFEHLAQYSSSRGNYLADR